MSGDSRYGREGLEICKELGLPSLLAGGPWVAVRRGGRPLNIDVPFFIHLGAYLLAFFLALVGMVLRFGGGPLRSAGISTEPYKLWDVAVVFLLVQMYCGMVLLAMAFMDPAKSSLSRSGILSSMVFQGIMAGVVVMVVSTRVSLVGWLGLRWRNWPHVLWIAPASVGGMWLFTLVFWGLGFQKLMEKLGAEPVQESVKVLQEANDPVLLVAMSVAAVVVAPICEEIVFRAYCYPVLKKYAGASIGLVVSSLFFACAHGSLMSFLPLFVLGALLVFIYEKTQSLWAPVAVHFLFNAATVLIQFGLRVFDV